MWDNSFRVDVCGLLNTLLEQTVPRTSHVVEFTMCGMLTLQLYVFWYFSSSATFTHNKDMYLRGLLVKASLISACFVNWHGNII